MKTRWQFATWATAAALSVIILLAVLMRQDHENKQRWALTVSATPLVGSTVFRTKGCATCHGQTAAGTKAGPALRQRPSMSSLPQLVTAMWNHAPRMWQAMQERKLPYPELTYKETSQLVSYLYISGYADNGGDVRRGEELFREKKCARCHTGTTSVKGDAPDLKSMSDVDTLLSWTQALWNHAAAMKAKMREMNIAWPQFQASDVRDLFAYVAHVRNLPDDDHSFIAGNADRGWQLFQQKGCIRCHAVSSESGRIGPRLGSERSLPPTLSEFGAAMLNHYPAMQNAMRAEGAEVPRFEHHDMTDVAVFLYSLHYLEPSGSPQIGRSVFAWRGCSNCHGADAEGTASGPALRGRGQNYTAVRLATDLWRHGARMYARTRTDGQPWPTLQDSDIGDLLAFLNTSPAR